MDILITLIQTLFNDGIKPIPLRIRFSLVLGIGTVVLAYALLNILIINSVMLFSFLITSLAFFIVLTPFNKKEDL